MANCHCGQKAEKCPPAARCVSLLSEGVLAVEGTANASLMNGPCRFKSRLTTIIINNFHFCGHFPLFPLFFWLSQEGSTSFLILFTELWLALQGSGSQRTRQTCLNASRQVWSAGDQTAAGGGDAFAELCSLKPFQRHTENFLFRFGHNQSGKMQHVFTILLIHTHNFSFEYVVLWKPQPTASVPLVFSEKPGEG